MIEYGVALDKVTIINLPLPLESQLDSFSFPLSSNPPLLHPSPLLLFFNGFPSSLPSFPSLFLLSSIRFSCFLVERFSGK